MNEDRKASEYVSGSRRLRPEEIAFEDEMLIIGNRLTFICRSTSTRGSFR